MVNFTETASFDPVQRLETTTSVQGGAGGASNVSLQSLANRDAFLKALIEAVLYQGAWVSTTIYKVNQIVLFSGSYYLSLIASNQNNIPSANSTFWLLLGQQGPPGMSVQGPTGANGINGVNGQPGAATALFSANFTIPSGTTPVSCVLTVPGYLANSSSAFGLVSVASTGVPILATLTRDSSGNYTITRSVAGTAQAVVGGTDIFVPGGGVFAGTWDKLVTAKDAGAKGDGITDDTANVQSVVSNSNLVHVPKGTFKVTSFNPAQAEFSGPGQIVNAANKLLNIQERDQIVFGREYLACFQQKILASVTAKIVCTGDSTTAGVGLTAPYIIDSLLTRAALNRGVYGISVINRGQSSKSTQDWITTYLAGDLALNPDLLIVRWGINDPFYGRTAAQQLADLESGLSSIRASKTQSQLSVLLCMPNCTNDVPNGRDPRYYETIRYGFKNLARKYFCTFVDLYSFMIDSAVTTGGVATAGLWLDDPFLDGRHIHPNNFGGLQIGNLIADIIFPDLRGAEIGYLRNAVTNQRSNIQTFPITDLPSTYDTGIAFRYAGSDFPNGVGATYTFFQIDGLLLQIYMPNTGGLFYRRGDYTGVNSWGPFFSLSGLPAYTALTPLNGWVNFGSPWEPIAYTKDGNGVVRLKGLLKNGTTTAGTILCTLPAGFRPLAFKVFPAISAGPPFTFVAQPAGIRLNPNGDVSIEFGAATGYLSLEGIQFETTG